MVESVILRDSYVTGQDKNNPSIQTMEADDEGDGDQSIVRPSVPRDLSVLSKDIAEVKKQLKLQYRHPREFNWAWQFKVIGTEQQEMDQWTQFECPDCLQLEFHYQAFKITGNTQFVEVDLLFGQANLNSLEYVRSKDRVSHSIRRTPKNQRKRPNAEKRHDPGIDD